MQTINYDWKQTLESSPKTGFVDIHRRGAPTNTKEWRSTDLRFSFVGRVLLIHFAMVENTVNYWIGVFNVLTGLNSFTLYLATENYQSHNFSVTFFSYTLSSIKIPTKIFYVRQCSSNSSVKWFLPSMCLPGFLCTFLLVVIISSRFKFNFSIIL